MFEDTLPPASISPALVSCAYAPSSLVNDSVIDTSPIAMSPDGSSPVFDATTTIENTCASCKKSYLISTISDDLFCHDCTWFLENSEPKTEEEIELEKLIRNFSDDDIREVGLGHFFELEDPSTATISQKSDGAPMATASNSSHIAQVAALTSQMMHQRKDSAYNHSQAMGFNNQSVSPSMPPSQSQLQAYISSRPSMPVTEEAIRQWAIAHKSNSRNPTAAIGHSRTNSTALSQPGTECMDEIYESPSVQVEVKKAIRKRGKRMICATCEKDSPISDKNDGVNCTRCFGKLKRAAETLPLVPDVGGEKRSYEDALDGYSPADGSPSKFMKYY